jgi:hypothetical protein
VPVNKDELREIGRSIVRFQKEKNVDAFNSAKTELQNKIDELPVHSLTRESAIHFQHLLSLKI